MTGHAPALRVVLASDSALNGDGMASLLCAGGDVAVVGRAHDQESLARAVAAHTPDAVIVNIRTPMTPSASAARRLRDDHPDLPIVVIADRGNGFAVELLRGGAAKMAYLLESRLTGIDAVSEALREVMRGATVLDPVVVEALVHRKDGGLVDALTLREIEVLEHLALGRSNRSIALELQVTHRAVENHVSSIYRKLGLLDDPGVDRRVSAALAYQRASSTSFPTE